MLPIEADGLPTPRRIWAVVAVSVSIAITVLDSHI
jgi:MFS transporter, DHA2 family, multidrug resistance protein